ncbi:MAG: 2-oxo acid dehydrogenase subunit E2 [Rhodanobacter sp.]
MPAKKVAPAADADTASTKPGVQQAHVIQAAPASASSSGVRASPYARSLARDLGVDLEKVAPGPDGIVQPAAVVRAFGQPPAPNLDAGPSYRMEPLSSMRQAMAKNMIACLSTPTFRVSARVSIQKLRETAAAKKISLTVLIARACAITIKDIPIFNAVYTPDGLARRDRVDIAIAVDSPDGLITPVLRDVGERALAELVGDWHTLRDKVKHRRLAPQEYQGGTFYVSNLGMFPAVHDFDAILPLGAAAILCVGAESDGQASFTLSCDHRVVSGADGARFLQELGKRLSEVDALSS